jgi:hypothetical protein
MCGAVLDGIRRKENLPLVLTYEWAEGCVTLGVT